jgi:hypothetical protein
VCALPCTQESAPAEQDLYALALQHTLLEAPPASAYAGTTGVQGGPMQQLQSSARRSQAAAPGPPQDLGKQVRCGRAPCKVVSGGPLGPAGPAGAVVPGPHRARGAPAARAAGARGRRAGGPRCAVRGTVQGSNPPLLQRLRHDAGGPTCWLAAAHRTRAAGLLARRRAAYPPRTRGPPRQRRAPSRRLWIGLRVQLG